MSLESENDKELLAIQTPHPKGPLTTPLGRFIDSLSYVVLLGIVFVVLEYSSVYYYLATPLGGGITFSDGRQANSFWDALYFSIVTFTTLGYGDVSPQGIGRLVAGLVVFSGLGLVSLFVGKVASERQYAMLLLLHTSDCQRRLKDFSDDLESASNLVNSASSTNNLHDLRQTTKDLASLLESMFNYVVFHVHQSKLTDFGNDSALAALLIKLRIVQESCVNAFKSPVADEVVGRRSLSMAKRVASFERLICGFKRQPVRSLFPTFKRIVVAFITRTDDQSNIIPIKLSMQKQADSLEKWALTHMSNWLLVKVHGMLPSDPRASWTKHQHKRVAKELGISNSLAQQCISKLISTGEIL